MVAGTPRARSAQSVTEPAAEQAFDRRPSHRPLRAELAHVYEATFGQTCRHDTLDALVAIERWLRGCEANEGLTFLRSVPQAVRAIDGWQATGRKKLDHSRFRNSLVRRLDMLVAMGRVERWEAVYAANGEGRGILVSLRRDSSVGRAPLRRPGFSFQRRVSPPLRENGPSSASRGSLSSRKTAGARERARVAGHRATAAAISALQEAGEGDGASIVGRCPWLCRLAPTVLLRAATMAFAPRRSAGWARHWHTEKGLRLSCRSALIAETAIAQLDRLDGGGAGTAAAIDLAAGGWRRHLPPGTPFPEPRTAGAIALALRREARMRAAHRRRGGGLEPVETLPGPVEDLSWA